MLTFIFSHKTQSDAISSEEYLHKSMRGDEAYVNGDVGICVSTIDNNTKQPTCEDGNLDYEFGGIILHHCVILTVGTIDNSCVPIVFILNHPLDNVLFIRQAYELEKLKVE